MVRTMPKQIVAVALVAAGIGWVATDERAAHAGPPHPFHIDVLLMYAGDADDAPGPAVADTVSPESTAVPSDGGAPAVGQQPVATPRRPGAHVITAGDLPLRRPSPPGSVIAAPGGGFIATPGDAPVFVGPPGTQRAKILTP